MGRKVIRLHFKAIGVVITRMEVATAAVKSCPRNLKMLASVIEARRHFDQRSHLLKVTVEPYLHLLEHLRKDHHLIEQSNLTFMIEHLNLQMVEIVVVVRATRK